jgi:anti-sigma B factor antagonist
VSHVIADARDDRVRTLTAVGPAPAAAFRSTIHAEGDTVTVAPVGELDLDTVSVLEGDLRAVRDLGFEAIVVDLRGLTFIDSAGVHLLVRWAAGRIGRGHGLRLIPGSDRIQLVFRLNGLLGAPGLDRPADAA